MGLRFSKSVKLGKGVNLNLSKSGIGMSVGTKGMRVGTGPRGSRVSASIPGTGIGYSNYLYVSIHFTTFFNKKLNFLIKS